MAQRSSLDFSKRAMASHCMVCAYTEFVSVQILCEFLSCPNKGETFPFSGRVVTLSLIQSTAGVCDHVFFVLGSWVRRIFRLPLAEHSTDGKLGPICGQNEWLFRIRHTQTSWSDEVGFELLKRTLAFLSPERLKVLLQQRS